MKGPSPRAGKAVAGAVVEDAQSGDDAFQRAVEEAGGEAERAPDPVLSYNPAFGFPGNRGLESMLPLMQQDPGRIFKLERSNFLLAYQGEDDRQLQRRHADLLGEIAL